MKQSQKVGNLLKDTSFIATMLRQTSIEKPSNLNSETEIKGSQGHTKYNKIQS